MCPLLIILLIVLSHPSECFPQFSSGNIVRFYEPVAKELQKLSICFQNCHIHVIIRGISDVPLNLIQNPYIQTLPSSLHSKTLYERCVRGHFAIPASTKTVSPCQTAIYINMFQNSAMADTIELVYQGWGIGKKYNRYQFLYIYFSKFTFLSIQIPIPIPTAN